MAAHNLTTGMISSQVIETMEPLDGRSRFSQLAKVAHTQVIILYRTPLWSLPARMMKKLNWPTLFCNSLSIIEPGRDHHRLYNLRLKDAQINCRSSGFKGLWRIRLSPWGIPTTTLP